ncbi:hypothetical protein [Bradyrhizobium viridifuturi]|uniref:hypothetical protein n=1 Tax=Bradyrhizobium viridifuturi TaxID=1654716 RepID=UPI000FE14C58|nr:hypothetical protein [Bradyrhizobium viridifuturi]
MIGLLLPAHAIERSSSPDALPNLPSRTAERFASAELRSRLPWLAPIGHHQPSRADVPQSDVLSAQERDQQQRDRMLDHKLIICRGC